MADTEQSLITILEEEDTFNVVVQPELDHAEMLLLDVHGVVSGRHRESLELPDGEPITLIRANDDSLIGTREHRIDDARTLAYAVRDSLIKLRGDNVKLVGKLALSGAS